MSYNGTVRCGHCYQKGHNRATCTSLKEQMQRRLDENPEDWYAKHFFEKESTRKGKKKSCGYCTHPGHTRRTCLELKHAKKVAVKECAKWRKEFVELMATRGIGVGTLVRFKHWNELQVGVITQILWSRLDHRIKFDAHALERYSLIVNSLEKLGERYGSNKLRVPEIDSSYARADLYADEDESEFVGPIPRAQVESQVPANFLTGEDCIEAIFLEEERSQDRTSAWQVSEWCKLQGFYGKDSES
jgi:hypothetical protein